MRGSSDELLRLYRRIDEKDQEIQSLKNQIEDLRRAQRTPPRYRSRSRSPPPMIRKRVREEGEFIERIGSETDIYIGNFFARTVNLDEETFFQYLTKSICVCAIFNYLILSLKNFFGISACYNATYNQLARYSFTLSASNRSAARTPLAKLKIFLLASAVRSG